MLLDTADCDYAEVESRYDRLHDQLAECELLDPEAGEPEDWPGWTDEVTWELGPGTDPLPCSPPPPEPAPFEPSREDREWIAEQEATAEDRAEY
jgi:hypothetical protein